MRFRRLGRTGLQVSELGFGTWVTFAEQGDPTRARELLLAAREMGINHFDTADAYGAGRAEALLGATLAELPWSRAHYVLATKLYWGTEDVVNLRRTLNRKYVFHAIDASLDRLRTRFVDIVFCHRPDPETPVEETVWAMSDIVACGKAHYWGTSGWSQALIREALEIAERRNLRAPVVVQPEYNLIERDVVEVQLAGVVDEFGLGVCTWSPLASGLLTGKYCRGTGALSRADLAGYEWLARRLRDETLNARVESLLRLAQSLGHSPAQLAIAWCLRQPRVSSVILGASSAAQLRHNVEASRIAQTLSPTLLDRITTVLEPEP